MPSLEDLFGQSGRRSVKNMTDKERVVRRSVEAAMRRLRNVRRKEIAVAKEKQAAEKALEAARRKCRHAVTALIPGAYGGKNEICTLCGGTPS